MKRYYAAIFLFLNVCSFAQTNTYNDAQLWFNLYLEKKVSNRFAIHLNQQDRWTSNVSLFNFAYADIGDVFIYSDESGISIAEKNVLIKNHAAAGMRLV